MTRKASNIFSALVGIGSVYAISVFVWSWFPGAFTLADLFDWLR